MLVDWSSVCQDLETLPVCMCVCTHTCVCLCVCPCVSVLLRLLQVMKGVQRKWWS